MGYGDSCSALHKLCERILDIALCFGIHCRSSLIENKDTRILNYRSGYRYSLALAAGKVVAARSDARLIGIGQFHNKIMRTCRLCRGDYLIHCGIRLCVANIIGYRADEQIDILRDQTDILSDSIERQVAHIDSVDFDAPGFRVIEPRYKIRYCCFARSGFADYSEHLTSVHFEVEIFYNRLCGFILELEF